MRCTRTIGRSTERAALAGLVEAACEGRGGTVFLVGEPGIGKSRLADDTADLAEHAGLVVLHGRAVDGPHRAAFRPLTEALLTADRRGLLPGAATLDGFVPALATLMPHLRRTGDAVESSLEMIAEALLRLLADQRGHLLVLEDLHWADSETLAVVRYLADNIAGQHLALLATLRPEHAARAVAEELNRRRCADILALERLGPGDIAQLVDGCLGDVSVPDVVWSFVAQRCEGVPFFAEELLSGLVSGGALRRTSDGWKVVSRLVPKVPLTVRDSIRQRVAHPVRLRVLEAAAVLGRRFDARLLPEIAGQSPDEVFAALRDAASAQLVDESDGTYRFRHALTRDAVLEDRSSRSSCHHSP